MQSAFMPFFEKRLLERQRIVSPEHLDGAEATYIINFLSDLFTNPRDYFIGLGRGDICDVLQYLFINPTNSELLLALWNSSVDLRLREKCVLSTPTFFKEVFAKRCLEHSVRRSQTTDCLNVCCYMWWECFPTFFHLPDDEQSSLVASALTAMREILQIDHKSCQEAAIHGLGHWAEDSSHAITILDNFLSTPSIDPEMKEYAVSARTGKDFL